MKFKLYLFFLKTILGVFLVCKFSRLVLLTFSLFGEVGYTLVGIILVSLSEFFETFTDRLGLSNVLSFILGNPNESMLKLLT